MIADIFLTVFGGNFNCNACFQFIFIVCQIKKKKKIAETWYSQEI